jgi:hypothetical protein
MNRYLSLLLLLFATWVSPAPSLMAQTATAPTTAHISFEFSWPSADPQWYELVVQPDGSALYRSLPHQDSNSDDPAPAPYKLSFTLSPRSRQTIFALVPIQRFQGTLDKIKVAFTGTKIVRYEDGTGLTSTLSYNYSLSPELTRFTELMQGISDTIESAQTLRFQLRFDKLALDATLRSIENLVSIQRFAELQLMEPELNRIANDPSVMNIARQRARRLLQAASQAGSQAQATPNVK